MHFMKEIESISIKELKEMANQMYSGTLVKAVVDIEQQRVVVDAEMHVDEEAYLLEHGSKQKDLWGINLYPDNYNQEDFIEFDSMVNIRPSQNNNSRGVENEEIQQKIKDIITRMVKP
jgi:uncharacterized protein DUF5674